jgi:hypothetical protein
VRQLKRLDMIEKNIELILERLNELVFIIRRKEKIKEKNKTYTEIDSKKYGTVKQTARDYSFCTEASLRNLIFYAKENGFSDCVRRVGRRVLIDYQEFEKYIDSHSSSVPITIIKGQKN